MLQTGARETTACISCCTLYPNGGSERLGALQQANHRCSPRQRGACRTARSNSATLTGMADAGASSRPLSSSATGAPAAPPWPAAAGRAWRPRRWRGRGGRPPRAERLGPPAGGAGTPRLLMHGPKKLWKRLRFACIARKYQTAVAPLVLPRRGPPPRAGGPCRRRLRKRDPHRRGPGGEAPKRRPPAPRKPERASRRNG